MVVLQLYSFEVWGGREQRQQARETRRMVTSRPSCHFGGWFQFLRFINKPFRLLSTARPRLCFGLDHFVGGAVKPTTPSWLGRRIVQDRVVGSGPFSFIICLMAIYHDLHFLLLCKLMIGATFFLTNQLLNTGLPCWSKGFQIQIRYSIQDASFAFAFGSAFGTGRRHHELLSHELLSFFGPFCKGDT